MQFYRWFSLIFTSFVFLYLVSFLVIRPVTWYAEPPAYTPEDFYETEEEPAEESYTVQPQELQDFTYWKPGLIREIQEIRDTITITDDPLLESDARPEILFQNLERAYIIRLALLTIVSIWSVLLLLNAYTAWKRHWFSYPMTVFIHLPLMLGFLTLLLSVRRTEILDYGYNTLLTVKVLTEGFFVSGSAAIILRSFLPRSGAERAIMTPFMQHLITDRASVTGLSRSFLSISWHIILIGLISLAAANALLLPVYIMQQSFPAAYSALLSLALAMLAFFYITAYARVSSDSLPDGKREFFAGAAFLGYRFLRNSFVIFASVSIVGFIIGMIIISALMNIDALQTFQILEAPEHL